MLDIVTAPTDGTVVLTDEGFVRYINPHCWASPVSEGWACCSPDGTMFECTENGMFYCSPRWWRTVPVLMGN